MEEPVAFNRLMTLAAIGVLLVGTAPVANAAPDSKKSALSKSTAASNTKVKFGFPGGFYMSLGLGGATLGGDRGIVMLVPDACSNATNGRFLWYEPDDYLCVSAPSDNHLDEVVRTDFGSGFAFQFRMGYTIEGWVSIEAALSGHGDPGKGGSNGMGHVGGQLRYHFANHITPFNKRRWDVDVFLGAGYTVGGYQPDQSIDDDAKAWEGWFFSVGSGFRYLVSKRVSVGLDLKFILPTFTSWVANWEKNYVSSPVENPSTVIFSPTAEITFHL
jgi:hypothetical protein